MFITRNIIKAGRTARLGVRFQSSSSSSSSPPAPPTSKLVQEKTQKIQLHKGKIQQKQGNNSLKQATGSKDSQGNNGKLEGNNNNNNNNGKNNNGNNGNNGNEQVKMIIKRGFSNVEKVPNTINLEPRDVLLDKLYQGFNPLLSPIKPKIKKTSPKILVNIYEDLGFEEDEGFESDDGIESLLGPKLHISKYIFDKNPEMEAKLKELDSNKEDDTNTNNNNNKNSEVRVALFEKRVPSDSKRGRERLHFKKNMKKNVDDNGDEE